MVVGLCGGLLFLFVPESFWDRSPVPKSRGLSKASGGFSRYFFQKFSASPEKSSPDQEKDASEDSKSEKDIFASYSGEDLPQRPDLASQRHSSRGLHVGFAGQKNEDNTNNLEGRTDGSNDSPKNPTDLSACSVTSNDSRGMLQCFKQTCSIADG